GRLLSVFCRSANEATSDSRRGASAWLVVARSPNDRQPEAKVTGPRQPPGANLFRPRARCGTAPRVAHAGRPSGGGIGENRQDSIFCLPAAECRRKTSTSKPVPVRARPAPLMAL